MELTIILAALLAALSLAETLFNDTLSFKASNPYYLATNLGLPRDHLHVLSGRNDDPPPLPDLPAFLFP